LFDIIFKNVVLQISDYSFTIFALAVLLTSWIVLAIGIITLIREKASRESIFFSLTAFTIFLWMSSNSFMYASPNEETAIRWDKLAQLAAFFQKNLLFSGILEV